MLPEGSYVLTMNDPVVDAGKTWRFRYWYDDPSNTNTMRTFNLNVTTAPLVLEAVYQQEITTETTPYPATPFPANATVTLTLTEPTIVKNGQVYNFQYWKVGRGGAMPTPAGSTNPLILQMTANTVVVAVYAVQSITLNVVAGTGGTVDKPGANVLPVNGSYSFTASPAANYTFDHWQLRLSDNTIQNLGADLTLSGTTPANWDNATLTALFTQQIPQTITLNVVVNGNGTVNPNGTTYNVGDTVTWTAMPISPSIFKEWTLNGTTYPDNANHTLTLPITLAMNGQTLTAYFEVPPQSTISGFVSDDKGQGIIGASITDGVTTVTSQPADGNFSIAVTAGPVVKLTISATGYATKVVTVDASTNVTNLEVTLAAPTFPILAAGLGLLGALVVVGIVVASRKRKG